MPAPRKLVLVGTLGLFFSLGCMCGDFMEGFEQGKTEALTQSFAETIAKVDALPDQPTKAPLARLCEQGRRDAEAGTLALMDASVWLGHVEAAIQDGTVTEDELRDLGEKYDAMPGTSGAALKGAKGGKAGKGGKGGKAPPQ